MTSVLNIQAKATERQKQVADLRETGLSYREIGKALGINESVVRRSYKSYKTKQAMDPALVERLEDEGLTDFGGLHSGWLLRKESNGSGSSLYFKVDGYQEKINFADAVREALSDIPKLDKVAKPKPNERAVDYANWIMLADLHVGSHYGEDDLEENFNFAIDDLVARLPQANKAVLIELGDLLDANDHKGATPHSGNVLDVKKGQHLKNMMTTLRLMVRAIRRLLETHQEVEAHLIKGNHDPSAYIGIMIALQAQFENNPRVNVVVTDDEFRVIQWGKCACFPHHGDTIKWGALKDVFADQYADEWALAKAYRLVATAHLHHDRKQDLGGVVGEQFRTLSKPSDWAKARGLFSRGSLTAITVHKEFGEEYRTISNVRMRIKS